jgi:NAD(P)-dependent dehydrogenase (short-subunit alcohol dehydrogenase family)
MDNTIRNIIISGASGTVGMQLVKHLLKHDYRVIGLCHSEKGKSSILDELEASHISAQNINIYTGDLTCEERVAALMKQSIEDLGSVDGFISAVGRFNYQTIPNTSLEEYNMLMDANLKSPWLFARICLPEMMKQKKGRMIFISSSVTLTNGESGMGLYTASKAALNALVNAMHQEVKSTDICINAVLPAIINTQDNRSAMPTTDHSAWVNPELLAQFISTFLEKQTAQVRGALIPYTAKL